MADAPIMHYDSNEIALTYQDWSSSSLCKSLADQSTFDYFGDLTGARVVEFGCGTGIFLKQCLAKGALYCLGFDVNESMTDVDGNTPRQSDANEHLRLIVQDCLKPIEQSYGQFDFALSHYVLHVADDEPKLKTLLKNIIGILKPGGKLFVGQTPEYVKTLKDQGILADLCGFLHPVGVGHNNETAAYYPAPKSVSESGRPFTREKMFTFPHSFLWSNEKLMERLKEVGFVNVALLATTFSDNVTSEERKQIESLEEPFGFIGAEKPKSLP